MVLCAGAAPLPVCATSTTVTRGDFVKAAAGAAKPRACLPLRCPLDLDILLKRPREGVVVDVVVCYASLKDFQSGVQ